MDLVDGDGARRFLLRFFGSLDASLPNIFALGSLVGRCRFSLACGQWPQRIEGDGLRYPSGPLEAAWWELRSSGAIRELCVSQSCRMRLPPRTPPHNEVHSKHHGGHLAQHPPLSLGRFRGWLRRWEIRGQRRARDVSIGSRVYVLSPPTTGEERLLGHCCSGDDLHGSSGGPFPLYYGVESRQL